MDSEVLQEGLDTREPRDREQTTVLQCMKISSRIKKIEVQVHLQERKLSIIQECTARSSEGFRDPKERFRESNLVKCQMSIIKHRTTPRTDAHTESRSML